MQIEKAAVSKEKISSHANKNFTHLESCYEVRIKKALQIKIHQMETKTLNANEKSCCTKTHLMQLKKLLLYLKITLWLHWACITVDSPI